MIACEFSRIEEGVAYVVLDESGNHHQTQRLSVGAIVTEDMSLLEDEIGQIQTRLRESPQFEGMRSFKRFVRDGFHHSEDPKEFQDRFLDLLARLPGFRAFVATSDRSRLSTLSDDQLSLVLYASIIPEVVAYATAPCVHFLFDRNEALAGSFGKLLEKSLEKAARWSDRPVAEVRFSVVPKGQVLSVSVVDYTLAVVSQWYDRGELARDNNHFAYRNYLHVEKNLALILDFDRRLRSTRANREFH